MRGWSLAGGGAAAAVVALVVSASGAADWSVSGSFSQRVGARTDSDGEELTAGTRLGLRIIGEDKRSDWTFDPGVRLSLRAGEGGGSTESDAVNITPSGAFGYAYAGPRLGLNASFSVLPEFRSARTFDEAFLVDPDTGLVDRRVIVGQADPLEITITSRLGGTLRVDDLNTLGANFFVRVVEYDEETPTLSATRSVGGGLSWSRALSPLTQLSLSTNARTLQSDSASSSDADTYSTSLGLSQRFSARHNGSLSGGLTLVDGGGGLEPRFSGGANFSYALKSTTFSAAAQQAVDQNDDGQVQSVAQLRGSISHKFDDLTTLSLGAGLSFANPVFDTASDEEETTLSLRAGLTRSVSQNWRMQLGYTLSGSRQTGDDEIVNSVSLSLSRSFDILR